MRGIWSSKTDRETTSTGIEKFEGEHYAEDGSEGIDTTIIVVTDVGPPLVTSTITVKNGLIVGVV